MNNMIIQILLPLLAAHFLGDFIFQTDKDVKNKGNYLVFGKHIIIITILSYLLVGAWNCFVIPITILVSHLIIDSIKSTIKKDSLTLFILDQTAHYLVIVLLSIYLANKSGDSNLNLYWSNLLGVDYLKTIIVIISIVMVTKFSGIIISYIIKPFQLKIFRLENNNHDEIKTGRIIGYLERIIILVLFIANLHTIVGFLITAKSILRYGEIKTHNDKVMVEYVLIGTLLSFTSGIAIAYLTSESLKLIA